MIADNPRIGDVLGEFTLQTTGPTYYVMEAHHGPHAYLLLGDPDRGPVVAKAHDPASPSPRFEFAHAWRANSPRWRTDVERHVLRICRAPRGSHDVTHIQINTKDEEL